MNPEIKGIVEKIQSNRDEVLANSLVNCHAYGLHSIVFEKIEGCGLKRLFIARKYHSLWRNEMGFTEVGRNMWGPLREMSVAFHPHHCDVKLTSVKGMFVNHTSTRAAFGFPLERFRYESPISGEAGKFTIEHYADGQPLLMIEQPQAVFPGQSVSLYANVLHTVSVPKGNQAAWVVHEGFEDQRYNPVCYSNTNLESFDFSGMYQPMTPDILTGILDYLTSDAL